MNDTYRQLISTLKHIAHLESVSGLLSWDEQVNLPPQSHTKRAAELSALAEAIHRAQTDKALGDCIGALENQQASLTKDQQCVLTHARKHYDRATRLPESFVAQRAQTNSEAYHAWTQARAKNDFKRFAPFLEKQIELCKQEAAYLNHAEKPYDYFIDRHDPGMTAEVITRLFTELRQGLIPITQAIFQSGTQARSDIFKNFDPAQQERFLRTVTAQLGFNYDRGRLDTAVHPFCGGSGADTRMTTRYDKDNPLDSLFSGIHETGHGLYEQGLCEDDFGTALGEAVGMAIHESQSRLWENQVARSRAFWQYWEPQYRKTFPEALEDISSEELYLAINAVLRNPIRVDSDEVTYNLHIMLRFDLEQRLFNNTLQVHDLPEAWNTLAEELLGITPANDTEGVLQDVHWSCGEFGYFPSYCLGNMIAAQLWEQAQATLPSLEEDFSQGQYTGLLNWLRERIHRQGKRYDTQELTRHATGEEISPKALLRYLKNRYLPLYQK